jgi:2-dehydropantoate 2-reductase
MLDIGAYPAGVDASGTPGLAARISAAFGDAAFRSEPLPDIMRWKYTKLLMNVGDAVQRARPADGEPVRPRG